MAHLVVWLGGRDERRHEIPASGLTLGRGETCDVVLLDESVSRQHARVELRDGRYVLRDLSSRNGTLVARRKITEHVLTNGQSFLVGNVEVEFGDPRASLGSGSPMLVLDVEVRPSVPTLESLLRDSGSPGGLRIASTDQSQRAAERLRVLLSVSETLASPEPISRVMEKVLDLAFQILDIDRAVLLLADGEGGALTPRSWRGREQSVVRPPEFSQHIVEHVRANKVAALFCDASEDPRLVSADSIRVQQIRASMCVPLLAHEKLVGVLYVDNRAVPDRFSPEDLGFLGAFASQAAVAIDNATLRGQIEQAAVIRNTLTRFFSPTMLQTVIDAGPSALQTREALVTAVFADLSDFTGMCQRMPATQVVAMLNDWFPRVAEIVFRHEGTIEKYIGDATVALWGAPFAHDDDADRAVLAAREILRAAQELSARWMARGMEPIQLHIGVSTGTVAVGNIGSDQYVQYAAIGEAINLASRVCGAAKSNEMLITAETLERLGDSRALVTPAGDFELRGWSTPIPLHRVAWVAGTSGTAVDTGDRAPVKPSRPQ